jgi:hypothetical protein
MIQTQCYSLTLPARTGVPDDHSQYTVHNETDQADPVPDDI